MANDRPSFLRAADVTPRTGSAYPAKLTEAVKGREKRVLGDLFGLDQFGVNHTTLAPGAASALRHWHEREDEFIFVLDGVITLVDDAGAHELTSGMCAGFKAGITNGHHLVNRSQVPASYLEIGTRSAEEVANYPDNDLSGVKTAGKFSFTRKDGTGY